jgi:hypothetical protein
MSSLGFQLFIDENKQVLTGVAINCNTSFVNAGFYFPLENKTNKKRNPYKNKDLKKILNSI